MAQAHLFLFFKKCNSEDTAQELTQQTFIKIWNYRQTLSLEHSFEAQLFQTAKHVLIDEFRSRAKIKKLHHLVDSNYSSNPADSEQHSITFENQELLEKALQQLPPMRRKVFILHRLQGYSYKEIASQLSISVKTVDNHLSQAVKQLKDLHVLTFLLLLWGRL